MKLSILDQAPISSGQSARDALMSTVQLAKEAEKLGYQRFWITEHHSLNGLASSVPDVLLGYIGAVTKKIRIGSGAVLLPHYKPYHVAEAYNTLATLFPGRVDIGIGRAPGGSAEATQALSDHYLQQVYKLPELIKELLGFLHGDFPENHIFKNVKASPIPDISPEVWLLGTSDKSARLAAKLGLSYAFGHFMSEKNGKDCMETFYQGHQSGYRQKSKSLVTVTVLCAPTEREALEISSSIKAWQLQTSEGAGETIPSITEAKNYLSEKNADRNENKMLIGSPKQVKEGLMKIQEEFRTEEIMLNTIAHRPEDRLQSFRLIAEEIL
ncbi:LLM class flavin-dependent oxidoreductase [Bacillus massiliglaciei]|uniref:LLM class flavin-dependent oxidoreductase n=1 Tax=Bacillus massiliglaciei TaxID=1816693 RepID=UPI000ACFC942|nr:LLM class flavin-dependent oxidoreductase [Bacillus massiliglaciei]